MGDLRKLALSRKIANGALDGQRMLFLFWEVNFLMLSKAALPRLMYAEAAILARELDTSWSYRSQELGTVYSKAVSYSQGKSVEFKGRLYPALYTPKNETLINLFEITSDEMAQMRTIIDTGEERRRHRLREESRRREAGAAVRADYLDGARMDPEAKAQAHRERNRVREEALRREAGAAEREAYLAERSQEAEERKSKARTLRERGMSYRAIADEMGVSVASVHNYLSLRD
jgi:hypothetical protein